MASLAVLEKYVTVAVEFAILDLRVEIVVVKNVLMEISEIVNEVKKLLGIVVSVYMITLPKCGVALLFRGNFTSVGGKHIRKMVGEEHSHQSTRCRTVKRYRVTQSPYTVINGEMDK